MSGQAAREAAHRKCARYRQSRNNKYNNSKRFSRNNAKNVDFIIDSNKYITNLSSKQSTDMQKRVLALGLKFIPSSRQKPDMVPTAVLAFVRANRLKYFFRNTADREPHMFQRKSTWVPPVAFREIEEYLDSVRESLTKLRPIKYTNNLSKVERCTLKGLVLDNDLVIKSADKGSGIVAEDRSNYIKDGLAHLSDENIYRKIASDPTKN